MRCFQDLAPRVLVTIGECFEGSPNFLLQFIFISTDHHYLHSQAALASARDAERHIAMALAAAADEKARDDEEVGNRHKSEPQIAAERELAIKVRDDRFLEVTNMTT